MGVGCLVQERGGLDVSRMSLIVVVGAFLGAAVARAETEWHADAYLGAAAFGVLSLFLFIGGAFLVHAAVRRSRRP